VNNPANLATTAWHQRVAHLARIGAEAVTLILAGLSPWALGSEEAVFQLVLLSGIALLAALWGLRQLLERQVPRTGSGAALCLAALIVVGAIQTISLPGGIIRRISAGTTGEFDRLIPVERETLRSGVAIPPAALPAGSSMSLYPAVTRREVLRLLAVLMLFVATRDIATVASLKRLSVMALVNGALLSLFGLLQAFSAPGKQVVYWLVPVQGASFGPFIYRNFYACYTNLCIGLGVGLLLGCGSRGHAGAKRVWIGFALALMIGALVYCQCRGGILVLILTGVVLLVWRRALPGRRALVGGLLVAAAVAVLLTVFGFDWNKARLRSVWDSTILNDPRFDIWANVLPRVTEFPLLGTGYGTYAYLDQPTQSQSNYQVIDHAHNDYLESLLEGGLVRLTLCVLGIFMVLRSAARAVRRGGGEQNGLALGGMFAFGTLVIHMAGDFLLHLPAITFLATVIAAHLCALGSTRGPTARIGATPLGPTNRFIGAAACLLALSLGAVLIREGWRSYRSQQLLLAACSVGTGGRPLTPTDRIACLEAAVAYTPESARLHALLGDAYLDLDEEEAEDRSRDDKHLSAALVHYVQARDLCPVMAKPHVRIAANREWFAHADRPEAYLERALSLVPWDAELWYLRGVQEMTDGETERADKSWKRSLSISDVYQRPIRARTVPEKDRPSP
jgi:O-antigen ligase